jgi:hypothetical protein
VEKKQRRTIIGGKKKERRKKNQCTSLRIKIYKYKRDMEK